MPLDDFRCPAVRGERAVPTPREACARPRATATPPIVELKGVSRSFRRPEGGLALRSDERDQVIIDLERVEVVVDR